MVSPSTDRRQGLNSAAAIKVPVSAASVGALVLTGTQTVDGVALTAGLRCLVKNQVDQTQNGIYVVDSGAWTRDLDFDGVYDAVQGTVVSVLAGGQAGTWWALTTANPVTFGSSAIAFSQAFGSSLTALQYTGVGAGTVARSAQSRMRDMICVNDYGADPTGVADSTAAFNAACAAANALGGADVHISGTYKIKDFSFGANVGVMLVGESSGYGYDTRSAQSKLVANTADGAKYAVMMPENVNGTTYVGLKNMVIQSDGAIGANQLTGYYPNITNGVEYGVIILQGATVMEDVTVQGFQNGFGIANCGNSNVFSRCSAVWNTQCGFFVTDGSTNAAFNLCHPNLPALAFNNPSTRITVRDCIFRRNRWGAIIRDGAGVVNGSIFESNFYGGLMLFRGNLDSAYPSWTFEDMCHFENNWAGFALKSGGNNVVYTVAGTNLLLDDVATPMAWTNDYVTNAASDAGYQIYLMTHTAGIATGIPNTVFRNLKGSCTGLQKAVYLKSAYLTSFDKGGISTAVGNDSIRAMNGTGGFYATGTEWLNSSMTGQAAANMGNRGYIAAVDTSRSGGINYSIGKVCTAQGTFTGTIQNGDMTVNGISGSIDYVSDGNSVDMYIPDGTFAGTSAAGTFIITGLADTKVIPGADRVFLCLTEDNGAAFVIAIGIMKATTGNIELYKNANGNAFTNAGAKAVKGTTITYKL